jgi:glutathione S-transferase/RNA polymerase-associated protein
VYPFVKGSAASFDHPPARGSRLEKWLSRADERESARKASGAAAEFLRSATAASLPVLLASGTFRRQYRDHRLEWMVRSGGLDVVIEGMRKSTIRFSEELG